jgi:hypothetical protein
MLILISLFSDFHMNHFESNPVSAEAVGDSVADSFMF